MPALEPAPIQAMEPTFRLAAKDAAVDTHSLNGVEKSTGHSTSVAVDDDAVCIVGMGLSFPQSSIR